MKLYGTYFYGHEASDYAKENGYLDYGTLAKAFDAVLNNEIFSKAWNLGEWEQESGFKDNSEKLEEIERQIEDYNEEIEMLEEEETEEATEKIAKIEKLIEELEEEQEELETEQDREKEIFQWYIVSDHGAEILKEINETVYYHSELDMYLWGVDHYGTAWSHVLTDITLNCGEEAWK